MNIKKELKKYLSKLGKKGGKVKSEKKAQAARLNGKKGGRPKKLVELICLLIMLACTPTKELPKNSYTYFAVEEPKGLIYLMHGLYGKQSDWSQYAHMNKIVQDLNARGYDAVSIQLDSVPKLSGDGSAYKEKYLAQLDNYIQNIEEIYGVPECRYVFGISMGGFHALTAFINTTYFQEFYIMKPVLRASELNEYKRLNLTALEIIDSEVLDRADSYLLFDQSDNRVNGALALNINANELNLIEIEDTQHTVNMPIVDMFLEQVNLE